MPAAGNKRNLEDLLHKSGYEFSLKKVERREELQFRHRQQEADSAHEHYKDKLILWAVVSVVSLVSVDCVGLILFSGIQPETTKWATTLLTTVVAGGVGYMTGKGSK